MIEASMKSVIRINREKEKHFFDASTMQFFASRVGKTAYQKGDWYYFITSEQFQLGSHKDPRMYTIRKMHKDTGAVEEVSQFQEYSYRSNAHKKLMKILAAD